MGASKESEVAMQASGVCMGGKPEASEQENGLPALSIKREREAGRPRKSKDIARLKLPALKDKNAELIPPLAQTMGFMKDPRVPTAIELDNAFEKAALLLPHMRVSENISGKWVPVFDSVGMPLSTRKKTKTPSPGSETKGKTRKAIKGKDGGSDTWMIALNQRRDDEKEDSARRARKRWTEVHKKAKMMKALKTVEGPKQERKASLLRKDSKLAGISKYLKRRTSSIKSEKQRMVLKEAKARLKRKQQKERVKSAKGPSTRSKSASHGVPSSASLESALSDEHRSEEEKELATSRRGSSRSASHKRPKSRRSSSTAKAAEEQDTQKNLKEVDDKKMVAERAVERLKKAKIKLDDLLPSTQSDQLPKRLTVRTRRSSLTEDEKCARLISLSVHRLGFVRLEASDKKIPVQHLPPKRLGRYGLGAADLMQDHVLERLYAERAKLTPVASPLYVLKSVEGERRRVEERWSSKSRMAAYGDTVTFPLRQRRVTTPDIAETQKGAQKNRRRSQSPRDED